MEYSHGLEQKESQYQQADLRTKQLRNDAQRYNELKHEYEEKVNVKLNFRVGVNVMIEPTSYHFNTER